MKYFFLNYFYINIIRVSSLQLNKWYFLFIVVWNNIIIISPSSSLPLPSSLLNPPSPPNPLLLSSSLPLPSLLLSSPPNPSSPITSEDYDNNNYGNYGNNKNNDKNNNDDDNNNIKITQG